jgi:hypothetical protein
MFACRDARQARNTIGEPELAVDATDGHLLEPDPRRKLETSGGVVDRAEHGEVPPIRDTFSAVSINLL